MLKSSLYDYSDACMLLKGTIAVPNTVCATAAANNDDKNVIFKNCAPFTDCISEIKNTQVNNAKDIDVIMPMYNLIQHSDKPDLDNNGAIIAFNEVNVTNSFNFKGKVTGQMDDNGTKDVEVIVPLNT